MSERKYVRFRVDMYGDTKFKIIDTKPERDLIHHIWNRIVVLAGKVDLEGDLYLSKNIPYTIETLAIEFNREVDKVKMALEILMELEMVELTEDKIYRVINFAKHQNIKLKEKVNDENIRELAEKEEAKLEESYENQVLQKEKSIQVKKDIENKIQHNETREIENKVYQENKKENVKIIEIEDSSNKKDINKLLADSDIIKESSKSNENLKVDNHKDIMLEKKKTKKRNKLKIQALSFDFDEEEAKNNEIIRIGKEWTLGKNEELVADWSFG